jgi:hypothetical protein
MIKDHATIRLIQDPIISAFILTYSPFSELQILCQLGAPSLPIKKSFPARLQAGVSPAEDRCRFFSSGRDRADLLTGSGH